MKKDKLLIRLKKDFIRNRSAYLLVLPVILYYALFCYKPMYGMIIAFKNFSPGKGILGSPWAGSFGMQHFKSFFGSYYFGRLLRNTLIISITSLAVGFPLPIIFALMLNELKSTKFKRVTQTVSYMPHFISLVVVASLIRFFVDAKGPIVSVMASLTEMKQVSLLSQKALFVPIYVISGVWQSLGWSAIIYLAALSGVNEDLYDAAKIDGANRWKQTLHVTLPGISGTIIIMLLMSLGQIMSVGYEKIILLYNESIYETADVISTYVYRKGLIGQEWSYSTAVGLFNSVINFILIIIFNRVSRKVSEVSLW